MSDSSTAIDLLTQLVSIPSPSHQEFQAATYLVNWMQEHGFDTGSHDYFESVVELLQTRLHFRTDFVELSSYFFKEPESFDPKMIKKRSKDDSEKLLLQFIDKISKLEMFDALSIENCLREVAEENEAGSGRIIHPTRLAVSGIGMGPGLFEMLHVLGKDTVIKRPDGILNFFGQLLHT